MKDRSKIPPQKEDIYGIHSEARRASLFAAGKISLFFFFPILILCISPPLLAGHEEAVVNDEFFAMSLDELCAEPYVISTSRQSQKRSQASTAVSIITAEDIHYSGLTNIADLLRFYAGVDVLKIDKTRYATGVRGIHDITSDRTLVLLNGRNCNNLAFGGMEWEKLPVLLEDIARIEIVRGPGGAVWGANAYNGVINIITKKPEDIEGLFSSFTINEFGDTSSHARIAQKNDTWQWKLSYGYNDTEDSDASGAGNYISGNTTLTSLPSVGFSSYQTRDFTHSSILDFESYLDLDETTTWSFGAAYSNLQAGDYEISAYFPKEDRLTSSTRLYSRLEHVFDDMTKGYLQWFGNYQTSHEMVLSERYVTYENDIEGQLSFEPDDTHKITVGGNVRWTHLTVEPIDPQSVVLEDGSEDERWLGLFMVDRYQLTDRLSLESQFRYDWYDGTHKDWSARAALMYALDSRQEHVLRLATAKSFRAPAVGFRDTTIQRVPVGMGYLINFLKAGDSLDNEETWSIEAGYSGKLSDKTTLRIDTYYQDYNYLIGAETTSTTAVLENLGGAKSFGSEIEIDHQVENGCVSAWYAYNFFDTANDPQSIRSYPPADNKAGLRYRSKVFDHWTLTTNYVYNNRLDAASTKSKPVATYNRLDVTIAKKFGNQHGEFMIGVSDVFNDVQKAIFSQGAVSAHDIPGRTVFVRLQYLF